MRKTSQSHGDLTTSLWAKSLAVEMEPIYEGGTESIYKAYFSGHVREYPHKIGSYMVQYLHFRILKFPLTKGWFNTPILQIYCTQAT